MDQILPALRTLLLEHLANSQPITADVLVGGTVVTVPDTSRFRIGDQISFISVIAGKGEFTVILDIPDDKTVVISPGSTRGWSVAEGTNIVKSVNNEFIKGIFVGDLKVIPSFPSITIASETENEDWFTLRQTSHEYKLRIRVYVLEDNFETTELRLIKIAKQTREILNDHIRPIIDGTTFPITLDMPAGSTVVTVSDTSLFKVGGIVFVQDNMPRPSQQESYIKSILSPTALELNIPADFDYLVSRGGRIILVKRLLYDTRPESINYGVINKGGTFCKAADISYFAKEMIIRQGNILT